MRPLELTMADSVVVTGANSGIGLATALELARVGYDVIGTARTEAKARHLHDAAAERGVTVHSVLMDVADEEETRRAFDEIDQLTDGGPWAVVNNAGFAQSGAVEDVSLEDARYQLEVNLVAPARIAQLVLPRMRERGDGRIVNISSIAGRVSSPLTGWYGASKHGLEALSDSLRMEVARFGVKVVLIEPGGFGTGIWEGGHDRLPTDGDSPYADVYDHARAWTRRGSNMFDPIWVARVIRIALRSPKPLPRYLVGADAVGLTLSDLAPTAVTDLVKRRAARLTRAPRPDTD
jgi:NAD(P)-dependent dehydrogenase (short-subunit alcohol dehydrogenase family)